MDKICSKCKLKKEQMTNRRCNECLNKYRKERIANLSDEDKQKLKEQKTKFNENLSEKQKQEKREKEKLRYLKKKANLKPIEINPDDKKICTVCKLEQNITNFHLAKNKGHIRAMCKNCSSLARKEYYKNNKKAVNKQVTQYQVNKMKINPIYKMERRLRCRIYNALLNQNQNKDKRTLQYIGCTSKFFQDWIEFQLYDGMTMENYGKIWHIDHVKPCAKFDLSKEDQVMECFNWKNLRPLSATKNLEKNCKLLQFDILLQELKAKVFLKNQL